MEKGINSPVDGSERKEKKESLKEEMNDVERVFVEGIKNSRNFDDLYKVLKTVDKIQITEDVDYTSGTIISMIDDIRAGRGDTSYLTKNAGIKRKVEELLGKTGNPENNKEETESRKEERDTELDKPSNVKFGDLTDKEQAYIHSHNANNRKGRFYQNWNFITKEDLKLLEDWGDSDIEKVVKFGDLSEEEQAFLHSYKANKRLGGFYQNWSNVTKEDLQLLEDWRNGKFENNRDQKEKEAQSPEVVSEDSTEELKEESEDKDAGPEGNKEQIIEGLEGARNRYIEEHNKYLKGRKKEGFLAKIREGLGIGKREKEEDLPESLLAAKEDYDKWKVEYGNFLTKDGIKNYNDKFKGLVRAGDIDPQALQELNEKIVSGDVESFNQLPIGDNETLTEEHLKWLSDNKKLSSEQRKELEDKSDYEKDVSPEVKGNVFDEVFLKEYGIIKQAEAETWTPKEKGILRRGLDKWRDMGPWKRFAVSTALLGVGTGLTITGLGTLGAGVLFGRSILGGIGFGHLGGAAFEKFVKDNSDTKREARIVALRRYAMDNNLDLNNLGKIERQHKLTEEQAQEEKRRRQINKALAMAASGLLGVLGVRALSNLISGGINPESAPDSTPTPESAVTPETSPEPPTTTIDSTPTTETISTTETYTETQPPVLEQSMPTPEPPVIETTSGDLDVFRELHNTDFNPLSQLDQAKMNIIKTLFNEGIVGNSNGMEVSSPLVDRVINSIFDAQDTSGWQSVAEKISNQGILEQIKALQEQTLNNPSFVGEAENQIRNLLK